MLKGVNSTKAKVSIKAVIVEWDDLQLNWKDVRVSLEKIGYPPEE